MFLAKKKKKKNTEIKDADCHSIHYVMNGIRYQLEMLVRYSLIRKALTIAKGSMDAHGHIVSLYNRHFSITIVV